ncbi:hypothetical protein COS61_00800, partial [Candidatus Wolfebacteria bacterium CG03_land_8_20_14_0_80_40_12]
ASKQNLCEIKWRSVSFVRARRAEKGVWGKCPEGVASRPYGVKMPASPSLFRRRRISCQRSWRAAKIIY